MTDTRTMQVIDIAGLAAPCLGSARKPRVCGGWGGVSDLSTRQADTRGENSGSRSNAGNPLACFSSRRSGIRFLIFGEKTQGG